MTKKLKVRMHPFELTSIRYTVGPDFQVACSGQLRYSHKYRQLGYNPKTYRVRQVKVETPYSFYGNIKNIQGSKLAHYARQHLLEACPTCTIY